LPAVLQVTGVGMSRAVTAVSISNTGKYLQTALPIAPVSQAATSGSGSSLPAAPATWPAVAEQSR
jgi:hypothetical protein